MPRGKSKALVNAASFALDLASGAYPGFVYAGGCRGVPVFCFHGVERDLFEAQLDFLARNGYRTATTDDMQDLVSGDSGRSVMLTFDDGWGSLWSVGMPLLKRYGIRIVVFLAAGRIGSGGVGPTLDDLEGGRCTAEEVLDRDRSSSPMLNWAEIERMHETGLVDFQSHTLTHTRAFRSPQIIDFARPSMPREYTIFQVPEWRPNDPAYPRLGRPIYPSSPRMDGRVRFAEDEGLRQFIEDHVQENGEESFFLKSEWRGELHKMVKWYRRYRPNLSRFETVEETIEGLVSELLDSKRMIEDHLPGKTVRHICYPWHCYSPMAVDLSREVGYTGNFLGKMSSRYIGIRPGSPMMIARVGGDFFFRLPGKGRLPLSRILITKLMRKK